MKLSGESKPVNPSSVQCRGGVELFTYTSGARDALGSKFLENTERLSKYALANYGDQGEIIKD